MNRTMSFRINRYRTFNTYSQTKKNMKPAWLLQQINAKAEVEDYLISQEVHADGGYHLHAYFKFKEKLDTKNPRFFDVEYYKKSYHPNIQKVKAQWALFRYIKKEGNYITNIKETRPPWQQILEDSTNRKDFLENIMFKVDRLDRDWETK